MRLQVKLFPDWIDASRQNPDGPPTFFRTTSSESGALQISIQATYKSGPLPNASPALLVALSRELAEGQGTAIRSQEDGPCSLGSFGSVCAFSDEIAYFKVWTLSNGRDFVLATHISHSPPDIKEVEEAEEIVRMVTLGPDRSRRWWQFWKREP